MKKNCVTRILSISLAFIMCFSFQGVWAKPKDESMPKAEIEIGKTVDKSKVKVNDQIKFTYTITPSDIDAKDLPNNKGNKQKEIVLIIDKSGSMDWDINGNEIPWYSDKQSRLDIVKESVLSFIDQVKTFNNVNLAVVVFSNYAEALTFKDSNNEWFNVANQNQRTDLIDQIEDIEASGGTNIGDAIRLGNQLLRKDNSGKERYFILMTDGSPTGFSYSSIKTYKNQGDSVYPLNGWYGTKKYNNTYSEYSQNATIYQIPTFYEGSGYAPYYFANGGSADLNQFSFDYAEFMANKLAVDWQNFFILFAHRDTKLQNIASARSGSTYFNATTSDSLKAIYEALGDNVVTDMSLSNTYFEETFPSEFEVIKASSGLTINGQVVSGSFGNASGNVNYRLSSNKKYYEAEPITLEITVKARKAGNEYYVGSKNGFIQYYDFDGTIASKEISRIKIEVEEYNPLTDTDLQPNQIKIDTNDTYTGIDIGWENSDANVQYFLLGDQIYPSDNSQDKYFDIDINTGKVTIRNMIKLREDLAKYGPGILEKDITVNTGVGNENLQGRIIVRAAKGEDSYIKIFDIEIKAEAEAITSVNRTIVNTANVNDILSVKYTFLGDKIMVSSDKATVPFLNLSFSEQFPPYIDIVTYPAGLTKTGSLETGYRLEGNLSGINLVKDTATGLYQVVGDFSITLKGTKAIEYYFNKAEVTYTDPNNYSKKINVPNNMVSILDNVKPTITTVANKKVGDRGKTNYVITVMIDGTASDVVETRYIQGTVHTDSMTLEQFKNQLSTSIELDQDNNPTYVNSIPAFKENKKKDNITFSQFTIKENGYYYIYTRDSFGNEEIKQIRMINIDEFVPILT